MLVGSIGPRQHEHVGIGHLLLQVGQLQELLVDLVNLLLVAHIHAIGMQPMLQGSPSAAGCEHDAVDIDAHVLRVDDLIRLHVLQHPVLMDAATMGKGVTSYDGLVGLHRHVHQRRHHAARGIDLHRVDVGIDTYALVAFQDHGNLLQRRIACPLADTVDGHLHLSGTVQHAFQRVRRSHAQIVMAMGTDDGLVNIFHMIHQELDFLAELQGETVARRVRNVHYRGTSPDHRLYHLRQIFVVRAACILGIELHVIDKLSSILNRPHSSLDNVLAVAVELILDVPVAGADARMYTLTLSILQGIHCHVDILLHRTRKGADGGPRHRL